MSQFALSLIGELKLKKKKTKIDLCQLSCISNTFSMDYYYLCFILGTKLYKNETIEIPYTVINAASKQQEVIVTIEDDKSFSVDPKSFAYTMKAGTNETGKFHLKGGLIIGETV